MTGTGVGFRKLGARFIGMAMETFWMRPTFRERLRTVPLTSTYTLLGSAWQNGIRPGMSTTTFRTKSALRGSLLASRTDLQAQRFAMTPIFTPSVENVPTLMLVLKTTSSWVKSVTLNLA